MMDEKRGQFYIISAVIIIFVIIGFAVVTNSISVKKAPEKFYDISRDLGEGARVVEQAEYTQTSVSTQISSYLTIFSNYAEQNTGEDFEMVIISGDITSGSVSATRYTTNTSGGVTFGLGQFTPQLTGSGKLKKEDAILKVNPDNTVNVTLTSGNNTILTKVPVLSDNNFVFIMTTSDEFNTYLTTSLRTEQQPSEPDQTVPASNLGILDATFSNLRVNQGTAPSCVSASYNKWAYFDTKLLEIGGVASITISQRQKCYHSNEPRDWCDDKKTEPSMFTNPNIAAGGYIERLNNYVCLTGGYSYRVNETFWGTDSSGRSVVDFYEVQLTI